MSKKSEKKAGEYIKELAERHGEDMMMLEGFDDCVMGVVERSGLGPVLCYDQEKMMAKLCAEMGREEAQEFFDYNVAGSWLGEKTPCFFNR